MKEFTIDELKKYFSGEKFHGCYEKTKKLAKRLSIHANGEKDGYGELITEIRPGESDLIKNYRVKIIVEKTKQTFSSVLTELNKIRKADDWAIKYNVAEFPKIIREGETLKDYCEKKFPFFNSVENWAFKVLMKKYSVDSNGVELVLPLEFEVPSTEYRRPYPIIFPAMNVIDFKEEEYAVLKSSKKYAYKEKESDVKDGDIYYIVNTLSIKKYVQVNVNRDFKLESEYVHNLNYLPARILKGLVCDTEDEETIYESRFMPMAASLDEAIREYSDLQAAIIQHLHPEKAVVKNQPCLECKGTGKIFHQGKIGGEGQWDNCGKCKGAGTVFTSPYANYAYEPTNAGEDKVPWPPVVYIDKPGVVEIITLQDTRVDKHQYQALASINMQFLWKVPLSESGIAKEVDRDALNTFVSGVAEDMIDILVWTYRVINDMRYILQIPNEEERKKSLPVINIPVSFNIISADYLIEGIKKARDGKVSPIIVNALEMEYAIKEFYTEPEIREELQTILELNPLSGVSQDDKDSMKTNKGISEVNYIISCNIREFVKRAIEADKNFVKKKYQEKYDIIKKFAEEIAEENKASAEIENPLDVKIGEPQPV